MWAAFPIAFLLVGLAELGDKSQLLLLAFACRYKPLKVALGAALAIALLQLSAVLVGSVVGALLPTDIIAAVAGLVFIVFGVITWRNTSAVGGDGGEEEAAAAKKAMRFGPVLTVASAFLLAEFGDKTQLMTVSISADPAAALRALGSIAPAIQAPDPGVATSLGVWLGSAFGMLVADALAILIGAVLGKHLPEKTIGRVSAVVFVLFGVVTLVSALLGG